MRRKHLTATEKLDNLANAMVDDIMALSDGELLVESIENGEDPDQIVRKVEEIIKKAIQAAKQRGA